MQRSKLLAGWLLILVLLFPLCGFDSKRPKSVDETLRINRLVGLGKLWGYIKYIHPSLAYRSDIDWDAALISTIPTVYAAKSSDEYGAALQALLNILGDSMTRVIYPSSSVAPQGKKHDHQFGYQLTEDGILLITAGNYFQLWSQATQEKLQAVIADLPKARALVFDLRSAEPVGEYGKIQLTSSFSQIERLMWSVPFLTLGERSRFHRGFENPSAFSSGQYKTGFAIQNVKRITPAQNSRDIPAIFLLNQYSALLDSTIASQGAGKGLIIFDGEFKGSTIVKAESLDLGEGLAAQVRVAEPLLEDGTSGDLQPDVVVPLTEKASDDALKTALARARDFKPSTVVRKKLPAIAPALPDKSYSAMKYPALEYRLLAAFRIWNIIHYFFPYKHLIGEDWDGVLREFIPKFEQAKDALEYSLAVAEMMTRTHDSHAYVSGSVFNDHFGTAYPPIRVRLIENALVVTHFYDATIAKSAGLEIGELVLRVDGEDARTRLARYAKYIAASTSQSNLDKASLMFMNGKDNAVVTLTVRDRTGQVKTVKLPRKFEDFTTLYHRERSGDMIKLLPGNIGYVDLDRLTMERIDEMLERFKNTKAIIFDMRGYPNDVFWILPQRLSEKQDVAVALIDTPLVSPTFTATSCDSFLQMILPAQPGKWIYKGKTVMLIDERSMSQAEHTGLFLRAANGTKFIGSHTAGANGEITTIIVPGGIGTGFTGQAVRFPDGRQLQRIGLVPDVEVKPTIKGIQEGRDEVLDKAIRYLHQERNK